MRRLALFLAMAATMVTAGAAAPVQAQRADQLVIALITGDDLPGDWIQTKPSQIVQQDSSGITCNGQSILSSQSLSADVTAEFQLPDKSQLLEAEVSAYTGGGAAALINDSIAVVGSGAQCTETNADGATQAVSLAPISVGGVGDQSAAWQVTIFSGGQTIPGKLLIFRRGDLLSAVSIYAFGDTTVDDSLLQSVAQIADGRLLGFQS